MHYILYQYLSNTPGTLQSFSDLSFWLDTTAKQYFTAIYSYAILLTVFWSQALYFRKNGPFAKIKRRKYVCYMRITLPLANK